MILNWIIISLIPTIIAIWVVISLMKPKLIKFLEKRNSR